MIEQERARLIAAHGASYRHKKIIESSHSCGCFYCSKKFSIEKIKEWTDRGETALCPFCGIDSCLPSHAGFPTSKSFLKKMHEFWFGWP